MRYETDGMAAKVVDHYKSRIIDHRLSSIEASLDAIDEMMAEWPPGESAGRSRLARRRREEWVSHQIHGEDMSLPPAIMEDR